MTTETMTHLNTQTLIGYTDKRGTAWHYRADEQGDEPNHYPTAVPVEDVTRRLFHWTPEVGPVETTIGGKRYIDNDRQVIVRPDTGTVLGTFKSGYQVHDYSQWLLENVSTILDTTELRVGSAGLLKGGAVAWVQFELEDTLDVQQVQYRPFLTAATSLDGSLATQYRTGAQVVICDNTLAASLREKGSSSIRIRHSRHSLGRIGDVREALGIVYETADAFAAEVTSLTARTVTDAQWAQFVDAYTGRGREGVEGRSVAHAARKAMELEDLYATDERVAPWKGTAWGVVAATNTHLHHVSTVRGADRVTRNTERMVLGMDRIAESAGVTLRTLAAVGA